MTNATYEFTPESEREKSSPVVFTLRELTWRDMVALEDMIGFGKDGIPTIKAGSMKAERFLRAVVGWKNLVVHGTELGYSEENREAVPVSWFNAVVDEVNRRTTLSEVDERD